MDFEKIPDFKLTPAYCIFNKIAVFEQNGSKIVFMVDDLENFTLQKKIKKAFFKYISQICAENKCSDILKKNIKISFIKGTKEDLRRIILKSYKAQTVSEQCYQSRKTAENNEKFVNDDFFTADRQNQNTNNNEANNKVFIDYNKNFISANTANCKSINLLENIINEAEKFCATDIHIEKNAIKFRINGILENHLESDSKEIENLIRKIKIISGMNVTEKQKSQNGNFSYDIKNRILINVSVVPVFCNNFEISESLVMNLSYSKNIPADLETLGFNKTQITKIRELERLKDGLVLICGPNNAGKSTTIASILSEIQKIAEKNMKIISVENYPKYLINNVSQIKIESNFYNLYEEFFSDIFKQDPDVVALGEIQNKITAATALRASLSGRLVFATLHCKSIYEALLQLKSFNINRNLICSALKGVICQSLDFVNGKKLLYADVSLTCENFAEKIKPHFSETQTEGLFLHYTNYSEILDETMKNLRKKEDDKKLMTEISKRGEFQKHKIFIGNEYSQNGKNIRKKIG